MPENRSDTRRLDSWKDIAAYLNKDVRTVIRWEKSRGLPVHRIPGGQRNVIFAYLHELDAWLVSQDGKQANSNASDQPSAKREEPPPVGSPAAPQPAGEHSHQGVHVNKWISLAVGVCLLGLVEIVTVLVVRSHSAATVHLPSLEKLTDDGHYKINLRTDGTTLYFSEFEVSREILASSPVGGGPIHPVSTFFSNVDLQDVSNDGQHLLVMPFEGTEPEREVWIIPAQGGAGRRVGDVQCHLARWSPDNRRIACLSGTMIIVLDSDGSNARTVASFHSAPVQLAWSPDGGRLRFVLAGVADWDRSSWEMSLTEENESLPSSRKLALSESCCGDWGWTQNGRNFVYMKADAEGRATLAVRPENGLLARWLRRETELPVKVGMVQGFAPAKTGNALYVLIGSASRGELLKFDSRQKALQVIFPGLSATLLSFSRDGQWMTYIDTVDSTLWRSRADGTDAIRLTRPPMIVELSAWSPDGRQIAFMGQQPGKPWRIFLVGRDGGVLEEAAPGDDNQGAPTWSADGKVLAYGNVVCQETQTCWIRVLNLATRRVEKLPGSHGFRTARWSPDGKYIAALVPETHELMMFDGAKRRWKMLADSILGDNLNWSSDSQFIFADSPQGEKPVIERVRIRDGQRVTMVSLASLQRIPGQLGFWFGLAPDNSPILFHVLSASEVYVMNWTEH